MISSTHWMISFFWVFGRWGGRVPVFVCRKKLVSTIFGWSKKILFSFHSFRIDPINHRNHHFVAWYAAHHEYKCFPACEPMAITIAFFVRFPWVERSDNNVICARRLTEIIVLFSWMETSSNPQKYQTHAFKITKSYTRFIGNTDWIESVSDKSAVNNSHQAFRDIRSIQTTQCSLLSEKWRASASPIPEDVPVIRIFIFYFSQKIPREWSFTTASPGNTFPFMVT